MEDNIERPENEDGELFEHHRVVASKGQVPLRVDKFLMNFIENATRNKIQQSAKDGHVWVNDQIVKSNLYFERICLPSMKSSLHKPNIMNLTTPVA